MSVSKNSSCMWWILECLSSYLKNKQTKTLPGFHASATSLFFAHLIANSSYECLYLMSPLFVSHSSSAYSNWAFAPSSHRNMSCQVHPQPPRCSSSSQAWKQTVGPWYRRMGKKQKSIDQSNKLWTIFTETLKISAKGNNILLNRNTLFSIDYLITTRVSSSCYTAIYFVQENW